MCAQCFANLISAQMKDLQIGSDFELRSWFPLKDIRQFDFIIVLCINFIDSYMNNDIIGNNA